MKLNIKLNKPLHDILPKEWSSDINTNNMDYAAFRNLQHFKTYVSSITQKENNKCGVSYAIALKDLIQENSQYSKQEYEDIRNLVRSKLLKRKLITDNIYERYKSSTEGIVLDIGKFCEGDSECCLTPSNEGTSFFYELYINISYPYSVSNEHIREQAIKLLSVIEELERQKIYIKVSLVMVSNRVDNNKDLVIVIPLFSHKDYKSIETMSAVVNERLLRKFIFATMEDIYGNKLAEGYGNAVSLPKTINLGSNLDEINLFTQIYNTFK